MPVETKSDGSKVNLRVIDPHTMVFFFFSFLHGGERAGWWQIKGHVFALWRLSGLEPVPDEHCGAIKAASLGAWKKHQMGDT